MPISSWGSRAVCNGVLILSRVMIRSCFQILRKMGKYLEHFVKLQMIYKLGYAGHIAMQQNATHHMQCIIEIFAHTMCYHIPWWKTMERRYLYWNDSDSKVHGANMGPTWVLSAPDGPHVSPMNFVIWGTLSLVTQYHHQVGIFNGTAVTYHPATSTFIYIRYWLSLIRLIPTLYTLITLCGL